MRINKFIAQSGYCSRRKADELVEKGVVFVNDKKAKPGIAVDPSTDEIKINKKIIKLPQEEFVYIALNKPKGYITSSSGKQGKSVLWLLKPKNYFGEPQKLDARVFAVGRLDKDSEGLIFLTNDGDLANKLMHPKYEHEKEYEIILDKPPAKEDVKKISREMDIGVDKSSGIEIKKIEQTKNGFAIYAILKEGKNRQIRRVFGRLGYNLQNLKRIRLNKLKLGTLPTGKWKFVEKKEII